MPDVSVVIPAMNEEETIASCIERVKRVFNDYHISGEIVVADNSSDRTPEIARTLGTKVVTPDKLGYGNAYLFGFSHASGKWLVMGDGDGTYNFGELPKLLEPIQKGEADFVIGSRFKGRMEKGAMPWLHRYLGNPVLTWLQNRVFRLHLSDGNSGFRVITKEGYTKMELKPLNLEFAPQMNREAARQGLRIKEVPISYHIRKRPSKLGTFYHGWKNLQFILSHVGDRFQRNDVRGTR